MINKKDFLKTIGSRNSLLNSNNSLVDSPSAPIRRNPKQKKNNRGAVPKNDQKKHFEPWLEHGNGTGKKQGMPMRKKQPITPVKPKKTFGPVDPGFNMGRGRKSGIGRKPVSPVKKFGPVNPGADKGRYLSNPRANRGSIKKRPIDPGFNMGRGRNSGIGRKAVRPGAGRGTKRPDVMPV